MEERQKVWSKIAGDWKLEVLDKLSTDITLGELEPHIEKILGGKETGRVVVGISA
jgi:acrylyl-CoA reductase (NADPH)